MKIGIIGVGNIGKTLVQKLSAAGHDVKAANSRGPETIDPDVFVKGGHAATVEEALSGVDVVILSLPPSGLKKVGPRIATLPDDVVVIDTFNYYPQRDGEIDGFEDGEIESLWSAGVLGRPIVKAWNTIIFMSFAEKGTPKGSPDRIALPVAGDRVADRHVAMALVEDTGFDALDAGTLSESWRQQPGAPAYCTDLTLDELSAALAAADRARLQKQRDRSWAEVAARMNGSDYPDGDTIVQINRAIYM